MDPMEGLKPGRIVYFVFDQDSAAAVMRRRTDSASIAARTKQNPSQWPAGAMAHVGNPVAAGDVCPAMVVRVRDSTSVNLKVMLDGSDTYWAVGVAFDADHRHGTWHWMFEGQATRYKPDRVEKEA
jgi:hypothetical protein